MSELKIKDWFLSLVKRRGNSNTNSKKKNECSSSSTGQTLDLRQCNLKNANLRLSPEKLPVTECIYLDGNQMNILPEVTKHSKIKGDKYFV